MAKIYKIVLTGGPCGGKTTSLEKIKAFFHDDIKVISVHEIATMTLESGMSLMPENFNEETHKELTKSII